MNKSLLALALALSVIPTAALAQSTDTSAPTADQQQSMHQAFQQFEQQEMQLHQQMRYQMLSALTPVHRRAIGAMIGELAIDPNADPQATAKRIDAMLTSNERSRILAAHQSFATQSRALHEQMRSQMESMSPAAASTGMKSPHEGMWQNTQLDAGSLLLMGLAAPAMMHMEGAPPH